MQESMEPEGKSTCSRYRGFKSVWQFMKEGVWDAEITTMPVLPRLGIKIVRVIHLVIKGFREDECPLHSSALTFNTLLAIVPILALSLALARVFGGAELAQERIQGMVSEFTARFEVTVPMEEGVNEPVSVESAEVDISDSVWGPKKLAEELHGIVNAGFRQVEQINFAELGGVGLILLIWMVVAVLGRVEASFNRVWGVTCGRPLLRKFTDYLFMVIILPFLITMASALPVVDLVSSFNASTAEGIKSVLGSRFLNNVAPVLVTIFTLTIVVKFMPNTKVHIGPAVVGGIVSGLLFVSWLWICAAIQVGVVKYSKLYGSFAIVPIVLAWVYVSWEIILFGAEVAFAVQNCTTYRMEQGAHRANMRSRIMLALSVVAETGKVMTGGSSHGFEISAYAADKKVPVRLLNDIVDELVHAGILAELSGNEGRFALLRSPGNLAVKEIIDIIICSGVKPEKLGLGGMDPHIKEVVRLAVKGMDESLKRLSVEDLITSTTNA